MNMLKKVILQGRSYTPFEIINVRVGGQCSCQAQEIIDDLKDIFKMTDSEAGDVFDKWQRVNKLK